MATEYGFDSRQEAADHVTRAFRQGAFSRRVIATHYAGNNLWCISEATWDDDRKPPARWIWLARMVYNHDYEDWECDEIEDGEGYAYLDCPLRFLDMAPDPPGERWRAAVFEWNVCHGTQTRSLVKQRQPKVDEPEVWIVGRARGNTRVLCPDDARRVIEHYHPDDAEAICGALDSGGDWDAFPVSYTRYETQMQTWRQSIVGGAP